MKTLVNIELSCTNEHCHFSHYSVTFIPKIKTIFYEWNLHRSSWFRYHGKNTSRRPHFTVTCHSKILWDLLNFCHFKHHWTLQFLPNKGDDILFLRIHFLQDLESEDLAENINFSIDEGDVLFNLATLGIPRRLIRPKNTIRRYSPTCFVLTLLYSMLCKIIIRNM